MFGIEILLMLNDIVDLAENHPTSPRSQTHLKTYMGPLNFFFEIGHIYKLYNHDRLFLDEHLKDTIKHASLCGGSRGMHQQDKSLSTLMPVSSNGICFIYNMTNIHSSENASFC